MQTQYSRVDQSRREHLTRAGRAGFERAQLLMHSRSRGALQQFLSELSAHLFAAAPRHIRWHLDVDPIEFD